MIERRNSEGTNQTNSREKKELKESTSKKIPDTKNLDIRSKKRSREKIVEGIFMTSLDHHIIRDNYIKLSDSNKLE